jgi:ATP-dependent protease HslVU (ClpYQ) peptidase subunit
MTCVVGVRHEGVVYIGADSLSSDRVEAQVRLDPKVFTLGEFLIGFTSSWRMGQVLRYHFKPPAIPDGLDLHTYMVLHFVEELRTVAKKAAIAEVQNSVESLGKFLVGIRGRLFCIESDFQVGEALQDYAAVGSGAAYALGAMFIQRHCTPGVRLPGAELERALEAAAEHSPYVRRPWLVYRTPAQTTTDAAKEDKQ